MGEIPRAVLSEYLQQRLKDRCLYSAVFLTYKFDPGFFEQEVIPVLLDIPGSHSKAVRVLQLEDALKNLKGEIAVYYDANGLFGESESSRLDIRRIPIHHNTGIFHAKNVLLLVDSNESNETNTPTQSLLIASLSSNLTRAGWWDNVESCHVEEIREGDRTCLKDQLKFFLTALKRRTPAVTHHNAVDDILKFLRRVEPLNKRFVAGRLQTHFFSGAEPVVDFLDHTAGDLIRGSNLEIISPYFDDANLCQPLQDLIDRFQPRQVRVFLPRSPAGEGQCRSGLYDTVSDLPNVEWGLLDKDLLRSGASENAVARFVHAKVYRFFTQSPKREICFVGSANLTSPAFQSGGNLESGFLVDFIPSRRPEFWLSSYRRKPTEFQVQTEDEGAAAGGTRLNLRYHWDREIAEAFWDAREVSPELRLEARGVQVGVVHPLTSRKWQTLPQELTQSIAEKLLETSLFKIFGEADQPTYLLVQEEAMWKKPSLLLSLSVSEILTYWSLLTAEQRAAFIEARSLELALLGEGSELVTRVRIHSNANTLFDRFAGFFHAFGCLERSIKNVLAENHQKEASYRLFGKKYDSLSYLLDRIASEAGNFDDVERYVIVCCAQQLCREIKMQHGDFWKQHHDDVKELEVKFSELSVVRERLSQSSTADMPAFLEWFDRWFVRRASKVDFEDD